MATNPGREQTRVKVRHSRNKKPRTPNMAMPRPKHVGTSTPESDEKIYFNKGAYAVTTHLTRTCQAAFAGSNELSQQYETDEARASVKSGCDKAARDVHIVRLCEHAGQRKDRDS